MVERIPEPIPAEEESKSVIDILFDHYFETRKEDKPEIDVAYRLFCHSLLDLEPIVADEIMSAAAVLCLEYERAAYAAGMKVKIRLLRELDE